MRQTFCAAFRSLLANASSHTRLIKLLDQTNRCFGNADFNNTLSFGLVHSTTRSKRWGKWLGV
jgi:hypothetical protein